MLAVAQILVEKARELLQPGASIRMSMCNEVPILLAYADGKLLNALALIFRGNQVKPFT
jgi:hypothetical protein